MTCRSGAISSDCLCPPRTVGVWSVAKRSLREACERIGRPRATAAQNGRDVEGQRAHQGNLVLEADGGEGGPGKGTVYAVLSGEKEAAHGLAPSLWIYDELGIAPNRQLLDALQTASGKRERSLGIAISTQAADDRHPSPLIDDAVKNKDPSIVVQLIAAGVDEDPFDEAVIRRCNPALGIFSTRERSWLRLLKRSARRRSSRSSETCGLTNVWTPAPKSGC